MADETEREALIVALAEEALEWSDACTKACEAGAASAYQAERWSCAKRGVRAGLDAAGYRSPASLIRAWEMGRDAAAAEVLSAQGRWMMGYPNANAAHDVALSRLSDLVRALTPPPDLMQRAGDMGERVQVERVECETYENGFAEPAEPIWRIVLDGFCADFETETSAQNFAAAIDAHTSSGERRAPASPRHEWEPIVGLIRKGCCATERCWGEPVWALRAGGVRSHYCAKCKARIDALPVPEEGGDGD